MRPLSSAMLGLALSLALFRPALAQSSLEQSMGEANAQPGPRTVPGRVIAVPMRAGRTGVAGESASWAACTPTTPSR
jgi:hypothetical protein